MGSSASLREGHDSDPGRVAPGALVSDCLRAEQGGRIVEMSALSRTGTIFVGSAQTSSPARVTVGIGVRLTAASGPGDGIILV
jgi:hypothetical protein